MTAGMLASVLEHDVADQLRIRDVEALSALTTLIARARRAAGVRRGVDDALDVLESAVHSLIDARLDDLSTDKQRRYCLALPQMRTLDGALALLVRNGEATDDEERKPGASAANVRRRLGRV